MFYLAARESRRNRQGLAEQIASAAEGPGDQKPGGYHGNLVDADGRPWCFTGWQEYEKAVDVELARQCVAQATSGQKNL
jgi:hypothetical protein